MSAIQNKVVKKLTPLKKDLYEVTIDDETYELNIETVLKYRLVVSKEVLDLNEILKADQMLSDYLKIKNYLIKYPKTIKEVKNKYKDVLNIEQIIEKLKEEHLLDDYRYAKSYLENLMHKNESKLVIKYKLKEKGIDEEIINELLALYVVDKDKLKQTILKYKDSKNGDLNKTISHFLRKGYDYNLIKELLN